MESWTLGTWNPGFLGP
jgi:hypothetical protein